VTIPYLDPALTLRDRQLRLSQVYGFACSCSRCELEKQLPNSVHPSGARISLEKTLTSVVFGHSTEDWEVLIRGLDGLSRLPSAIRHEAFFKDLSERFERQTHDGPHEEAWITGRTLLALCLVLYPDNYPLTGKYDMAFAFSYNSCINRVLHIGACQSLLERLRTFPRACLVKADQQFP